MVVIEKRASQVVIARWAVLAMFFIHGAGFANWVTRIPEIKASIGLSDGLFGIALVGVSIGVISGLLLAGYFIARFGSRFITILGAVLLSLALIPIAFANSFLTLFLALLLAGFVMSNMDIAMNTQAAEVERQWGSPIMPSFHAAFSIGNFSGAMMGANFVSNETPLAQHFLTVAIVFAIVSLFVGIPLPTIAGETDNKDTTPMLQFPPRILWGLGAVAFASTIGEGSMADWSALYLHDILKTSESFAAYGFAAFALMMTAGRLTGDKLAQRWSPETLIRAGGALAALGILLALAIPQPIVAIIGFGAVGAGLSIVIPLVFSAAGNLEGVPSGVGIAGVASIGYAGFLAGPPIIGLVAQVTSLRFALVIVALLAASLVYSAKNLRMGKAKNS